MEIFCTDSSEIEPSKVETFLATAGGEKGSAKGVQKRILPIGGIEQTSIGEVR